MDKLSALQAFVKVVEHKGFAAAARQLNLSRSQVNRAVINLENDLGVQLLHRTTRKVAPTATGEGFYQRCRTILSDLQEAEHAAMDIQAKPAGILRINAPMTFGIMHLSPAITDFMHLYPDIRIDLNLSDRFVDPLEEGYDMTVRISSRYELGALIDHEVIQVGRVICASNKFLSRNDTLTSPTQLRTLPCLHYGTLSKSNSWRLIGPDGEKIYSVNAVLCANNAQPLKDAVLGGLGLAMLPKFVIAQELAKGDLTPVLPNYRPIPIYLTLLYPPNRHYATKLKILIQFLYERFGDNPEWTLS